MLNDEIVKLSQISELLKPFSFDIDDFENSPFFKGAWEHDLGIYDEDEMKIIKNLVDKNQKSPQMTNCGCNEAIYFTYTIGKINYPFLIDDITGELLCLYGDGGDVFTGNIDDYEVPYGKVNQLVVKNLPLILELSKSILI